MTFLKKRGMGLLVLGLIVGFGFLIISGAKLGSAPLAQGAEIQPTADINPSIPGSNPATQSNPNPVGLIGNLYQFALLFGGLLAFLIIVFAGIRYTLAADNPSNQGDAKDQIKQALLGLLLLLGAFIVLKTINPNLVKPKLPELKKIQATKAGFPNQLTVTRLCDSTKPSDRFSDGSLVNCGDHHEISDSESCLGVVCSRSLFGSARYCNLTDPKSFSINSPPMWSKGTCITTQPMQGVRDSDPSSTYTVTANPTFDGACGSLKSQFPFSNGLILKTGCSGDLSCVSYDSPPVGVHVIIPGVSYKATNFECR